MPTVEKTTGGKVLIRGVGRFSIGDRADVSEEIATYLTEERGDFEILEFTEDHFDESTDGTPEETIEEWHDWNEADWLELGYEQRTDDVQEGRVDDYLEEIIGCETSETVIDAVHERRDEFED